VTTRITDPALIEARLLELAHTTDAKLTAPALAYYAPCTIEAAAAVLDDLAVRDRVRMDVEDDGTIVYELYGRQRLPVAARPVAPPPLTPQLALVRSPLDERDASPALAALLTVFVPGAGHLYAGRIVAALLWFAVVGLGYALILPGLVLHLFAIVSAAATASRLGSGQPRLHLPVRASS
jgi:hypothetical protein